MAIHKHIKENISMPVIGAPLFLVSGPDLVIAQCKAGIIGSFPALNARPQHVLDEWLTRIKTDKTIKQVATAKMVGLSCSLKPVHI